MEWNNWEMIKSTKGLEYHGGSRFDDPREDHDDE